MSKESFPNGKEENKGIQPLNNKEVRSIKDAIVSEGVGVDENEEFFIVHLKDKDRYIPKRQNIPLVKENGAVDNVAAEDFAHAIARFPDLPFAEAIQRFREDEKRK